MNAHRVAGVLVQAMAGAVLVTTLWSASGLSQDAASPTPAPTTTPTTTPTVTEAVATLAVLRAELESKQAALHGLQSAESSLVTSLGELDESVARLDDERRAAEQQLASLRQQMGALEREAGVDETELAQLRARLQVRLRGLVADGDGGAARAILGAENFTDLALRRRYLATLAVTDARLVGDVRRVEASAMGKRAALAMRTAEASSLARVVMQQQALLSATRDERRLTLERVRGERQVLKVAAVELLGRHRELQRLVARLAEGPRYRPPTGRSGVLRASLSWPVADALIIRRFGSTVDENTGAEIVSNGIELRADDGAPVIAVADGRVVHTGWLRGFGRIVIVDHGEGHHTLSAHLSRVSVGRDDEVTRGQTIGFVGDTESHNGPKLYFELRENGRPRDPMPFLQR
jgi:septal ring factor EnvC (AmiA/AmiB activator)